MIFGLATLLQICSLDHIVVSHPFDILRDRNLNDPLKFGLEIVVTGHKGHQGDIELYTCTIDDL